MKLITFRQSNGVLLLRYEATYSFSDESMLDFMQNVKDDFGTNIQIFQKIPKYKEKEIDIRKPYPVYLHDREELCTAGGISIAGKSKILNTDIRITIYKGMKHVDVQVPKDNHGFADRVAEDNHLLDSYFDMCEINSYCRSSIRYGIAIALAYAEERITGKNTGAEKTLTAQCEALGIKDKMQSLSF